MPSYKPRITIYSTEEITKKLAYISKVENRSASKHAEYLIIKAIENYEAEHGEIPLDTDK